MSDTALVQLSRAQSALAECKTAMEAKQIADMAEAARVYLERTNASVATVNHATEIRLLAERQMGEFLKQMPKNQGAAGSAGPGRGNVVPVENRVSSEPTLAEIGITKKQSHVAQKLATIPEPEFRERIAVAQCDGGKLSTAKVLGFDQPKPAAPPTEAPVVDLPRRRFHPSPKFTLSAWCDSTRTLLSMRFSAVPEEHMAAAAEAVAQMAKAFLSENQTK